MTVDEIGFAGELYHLKVLCSRGRVDYSRAGSDVHDNRDLRGVTKISRKFFSVQEG